MAIKRIYDGFVPGRHAIEAYGAGGFRFAEISHHGSILALPSGIHAWDVKQPKDVDEAAFERVFAEAEAIDLLMLGMGELPIPLAESLRWRFRELRINVEVTNSAAASRTYNILLGEGRRVAAALIAVA